jgi:hypothetical protein
MTEINFTNEEIKHNIKDIDEYIKSYQEEIINFCIDN